MFFHPVIKVGIHILRFFRIAGYNNNYAGPVDLNAGNTESGRQHCFCSASNVSFLEEARAAHRKCVI